MMKEKECEMCTCQRSTNWIGKKKSKFHFNTCKMAAPNRILPVLFRHQIILLKSWTAYVHK
jgi:hypothetical protein